MGLMGVGCGAVLLQRKQRHHKPGRAEPALRAVALDHGALHAVQLALMLEVFHADQLLAVQGRHKGQAGIEAAIAQALLALRVGLDFAHDHRAGAAVATGAAFLGSGFMQVLAQVIEHGQVRVQRVLGTQRLVE